MGKITRKHKQATVQALKLGQEFIQGMMRQALVHILEDIKQADTDYDKRYGLVLQALSAAQQAGYQAGVRFDPEEPEWPVAMIELPTGQISWYLPQHPIVWDGHSTEEKYQRVDAYAGRYPWHALEEIEHDC